MPTTLVTPPTSNGQIIVRDINANINTLCSVGLSGATANSFCLVPRLSAGGDAVIFWTDATNDGFQTGNLYRRILSAGVTTLVSKDLAGAAQGVSPFVPYPHLNQDGSLAVFQATSGAGVYVPDAPAFDEKVFLTVP